MVEVEYMHFCDYAFPGENGKPCIIGIFDTIGGPSFPVQHAQLYIAVQLRGAPHEKAPVKIELGRPNGEVLGALELPGVAMSPDGGAFIQAALQGQVFPEVGRYVLKVISGTRTLQSKSLQLRKIQAGPPPPQTAH